MIDGKFNIVFAGRILPAKTEDEVKQNMAKLFKTGVAQIDKLFIGKEVTIKKNLDYAQAMKYQSVLKQAGALVLIKKIEDAGAPAQPEVSTTPKTSVSPQPVNQQSAPVSPSRAQISQEAQATPSSQDHSSENASDSEGNWSLAAAGAQLPAQDKPAPIPEPNLSELSLGNAGEALQEVKAFQAKEVDTSELSLGEQGLIQEPKKYEQREVDTSELSMGEAGDVIPKEEKPAPPPAPDVSHLNLN